jgi:hypothetical protein
MEIFFFQPSFTYIKEKETDFKTYRKTKKEKIYDWKIECEIYWKKQKWKNMITENKDKKRKKKTYKMTILI